MKPARVLRVAIVATSIVGFLGNGGGGGKFELLGVGGRKFGFLCGELGSGITGGLLGGGPGEIGGA